MAYGDPEYDSNIGVQPGLGIVAASQTDHYRPTAVDKVTGLPSLDTDDSLAVALIGLRPKPGKDTVAPVDKHYMTVRRNVKSWLLSLGSFTPTTLTVGQSYRNVCVGTALRTRKKYLTREYNTNGRVSMLTDCVPNGFSISATNKFFDVTVPSIGRYASGVQFFPTQTVINGTYNGRLYAVGYSRDSDAAPLAYDLDIVVGGAPGTATARTRLTTDGGYSATRTIPENEPFIIYSQAGVDSGIRAIFPRGIATGTVAGFAGLAGDTVTVTVTDAAGAVPTVLTEGVNFTAATSNAVTAANIARAIRGISGVTADAVGAVVRVYRQGNTTAVALATSDAANFTPIVTEATGGTTVAGDHWTISTRGTATSAVISADTFFTWNSIEVSALTFGGVQFRIRPSEIKVDWMRNLVPSYVGGSNVPSDILFDQNGKMTVGMKLRVEDRQYMNYMRNRVQNAMTLECTGDLIGSSTDRERLLFSWGALTVLPFEESQKRGFLTEWDIVLEANDTTFGANDFCTITVDGPIQYLDE